MKYGYLLPKAICMFNEALGQMTFYRPGRAKNVRYERKIRYSSDPKLYLNLCRPEGSEEKELPVFVYIHGGGWVSGRPEQRETFVSNIAAAGFFTVNVFYGYSPAYGHPKAVINLYDALAWVVANREKYRLDLSRIYLGGESAGAHLTATLGAVSSNEEYKARFELNPISKDLVFSGLLLNCGIYDMEAALESGFPFIKNYIEAYFGKSVKELKSDPEGDLISPLLYVTERFPRAFILSAAGDPLRYGSDALAEKLAALGVPHECRRETGLFAVHAFLVAQMLPQSKRTMPAVLDFLIKQ